MHRWILALSLAALAGSLNAQTHTVDIGRDQIVSGEWRAMLQDLGAKAVRDDLGDVAITAPAYLHQDIRRYLNAGARRQLQPRFRSTIVENIIVRLRPTQSAVVTESAAVDSAASDIASATIDTQTEPPAAGPPAQPDANRAPAGARAALRPPRNTKNTTPAETKPEPAEPSSDSADSPTQIPNSEAASGKIATSSADNNVNQSASDSTAKAANPAIERTVQNDPPLPPPTSTASTSAVPIQPSASTEDDSQSFADDAKGTGAVPANSTAAAADSPAVPARSPPVITDEQARTQLQDLLNNGRRIRDFRAVARLRRGDKIHVAGNIKAVTIKTSSGEKPYWLKENINLDQPGLEWVAAGHYRVVGTVKAN